MITAERATRERLAIFMMWLVGAKIMRLNDRHWLALPMYNSHKGWGTHWFTDRHKNRPLKLHTDAIVPFTALRIAHAMRLPVQYKHPVTGWETLSPDTGFFTPGDLVRIDPAFMKTNFYIEPGIVEGKPGDHPGANLLPEERTPMYVQAGESLDTMVVNHGAPPLGSVAHEQAHYRRSLDELLTGQRSVITPNECIRAAVQLDYLTEGEAGIIIAHRAKVAHDGLVSEVTKFINASFDELDTHESYGDIIKHIVGDIVFNRDKLITILTKDKAS